MAKSQKDTIYKVLKYLKKYRVQIALSLILSLIAVALTLYIPVLVGQAIDCIISKSTVYFELIIPILIKIGIAAGITALLQWLMNSINNRVCYSVVRDLRDSAFDKIQRLPLSDIDSISYGEIVSRVIADADQFADGLLMGFSQLFTGFMTILGTLFFMISIDIKIAAIVVILTPISVFAAKFIAAKTYSLFHAQSKVRGQQTAYIDEILQNQKVVKAFSYEDNAIERFDDINNTLEKQSVKALFLSSVTNPTTRFVNAIVYACVALFGAFGVISGGITVGGLSCFLSYATQYMKPFNEISGVITELENAIACAARIFELTDKPAEAEATKELDEARGRVSLKNVYFSYTKERPLIQNLNLDVKPGQKIAIVGPTGCGKTTLINLLMRFYDVTSGKIEVDGCDIRCVSRHSLRKNYGMVLQDTWIKDGTVKENVALANPDATDDEIIAACRASHAHSFIKRLPNGYDTHISDTDGSLSQGEKQLLCIARVMLCLPPMLILDEATSSIDTRTEMKIQDAFKNMMEKRTCFVVAHRLSTILDADIILVMKDGNIIEQGSHSELLAKKGFYYSLYESQFAK